MIQLEVNNLQNVSLNMTTYKKALYIKMVCESAMLPQ